LTIKPRIVLPVDINTDNQSKPGSLGKLNPRPEAIKMAPVVAALRGRAERFEPIVCTTAQHGEMIDQVQELFGLVPDLDLNLITPDQSLNGLSVRVITALACFIAGNRALPLTIG
jgi:UDP-N-acetylglucosamine 2-epimerase (non-hydrolysing)